MNSLQRRVCSRFMQVWWGFEWVVSGVGGLRIFPVCFFALNVHNKYKGRKTRGRRAIGKGTETQGRTKELDHVRKTHMQGRYICLFSTKAIASLLGTIKTDRTYPALVRTEHVSREVPVLLCGHGQTSNSGSSASKHEAGTVDDYIVTILRMEHGRQEERHACLN